MDQALVRLCEVVETPRGGAVFFWASPIIHMGAYKKINGHVDYA